MYDDMHDDSSTLLFGDSIDSCSVLSPGAIDGPLKKEKGNKTRFLFAAGSGYMGCKNSLSFWAHWAVVCQRHALLCKLSGPVSSTDTLVSKRQDSFCEAS